MAVRRLVARLAVVHVPRWHAAAVCHRTSLATQSGVIILLLGIGSRSSLRHQKGRHSHRRFHRLCCCCRCGISRRRAIALRRRCWLHGPRLLLLVSCCRCRASLLLLLLRARTSWCRCCGCLASSCVLRLARRIHIHCRRLCCRLILISRGGLCVLVCSSAVGTTGCEWCLAGSPQQATFAKSNQVQGTSDIPATSTVSAISPCAFAPVVAAFLPRPPLPPRPPRPPLLRTLAPGSPSSVDLLLHQARRREETMK